MKRLPVILIVLSLAACGVDDPEQPDATNAEDDVLETGDVADTVDDIVADVPDARPDANDTTETSSDVERDTDEPPRTYTIAVVSDLNSSYGSTTYVDPVHGAVDFITDDVQPDLVLSTGDMVAGQKAGLDYRAMWDGFHSAVTDPITQAGIPFAPTPGNHDASGYAAFEEERNIYIDEWQARRPEVEMVEDTYYPLRYAFRMGPALFVSLDDTTVGALGGPQMNWLETVLTDNADAPIKIVYGHIPLWPFVEDKADEIIGDEDLEALLETHGVDIFVSGHHHAYYPGRRGDIRMLSMACLGTGQRRLIDEPDRSERSVAVIELSEDGVSSLEAFAAPDYTQAIPRSTLPQWLEWGDVVITRDDG